MEKNMKKYKKLNAQKLAKKTFKNVYIFEKWL